MKRIESPPKVTGWPTRLDQVWFQHESPRRLAQVTPPLYRDLLLMRSETMDPQAAQDYVADRVFQEDKYRIALGIDNDSLSFTYATAVGFHGMEDPLSYPGFTYFFRLTHLQVQDALFGVISGDPMLDLPMERGLRGLERCLTHWNRHSGEFTSTDDPELGHIDPRVEVVLQFPVRPAFYVPQQEDRIRSTSSTASGPGSSRRAARFRA